MFCGLQYASQGVQDHGRSDMSAAFGIESSPNMSESNCVVVKVEEVEDIPDDEVVVREASEESDNDLLCISDCLPLKTTRQQRTATSKAKQKLKASM